MLSPPHYTPLLTATDLYLLLKHIFLSAPLKVMLKVEATDVAVFTAKLTTFHFI